MESVRALVAHSTLYLIVSTEAGISNPNVGEEKKQELRERLDEMESSGIANSQEAKDAQVKQGHKVSCVNIQCCVRSDLVPRLT